MDRSADYGQHSSVGKHIVNVNRNLVVVLAIIVSFLGGAAAPQAAVAAVRPPTAYVDPALQAAAQGAETLSLIVTATDSQTAAQAVRAAGGQVIADLWLIQAVAATMPAARLSDLASAAGVGSVVQDKQAIPSGPGGLPSGPGGLPSGPGGLPSGPGGWDGYVTQTRTQKAIHALKGVQTASAGVLPDGGLVSVTDIGEILITNADGSERARVSLAGGPFMTASVVADSTGFIHVVGEERIYALNSDGSIRWQFDGAREEFLARATLADGLLCVSDQKGNTYGLEAISGQEVWRTKAKGGGDVRTAPAAGPDGVVYILREKGFLTAVTREGSIAWTWTDEKRLR